MRNGEGGGDAPGSLDLDVVAVQFLVSHIQRKNETRLVSELPPLIDWAPLAAGVKVKVGLLKSSIVVERCPLPTCSSGWLTRAGRPACAPCSGVRGVWRSSVASDRLRRQG